MRTLVFTLHFCFVFLFAFAADAEPTKVQLSQLPSTVAAQLQQTVPELVKNPTPANIDQALQFLQTQTGVEQVVAFENDGTILFDIKWSQKIKTIETKGISGLSQSTVLSTLGLSEGAPLSSYNQNEGVIALKKLYRSQGWLKPMIDISVQPKGPGQVQVLVQIQEGPRTLLNNYQIESSDPELNKRLQKLLYNRHRGPFSDERLAEAQSVLREELKEDHHLRAEVSAPQINFNADETQATVIFRIEKNATYSVDFRGQKEFSARALENDVLDLRNFTTTNPSISSELAEKIRQAYLQKGYARVEVSVEEIDGKKAFSKRLIFTINEGPKVKIARIEVSGRISRKSSYYSDFIFANSSPLIQQRTYHREELDKAFENLIVDLQNQGYLLARLVSLRSQYNRDRTQMTIFAHLDEGPQTLVGEIQFIGNKRLSTEELRNLIHLQPKQPLRLNEIENAIVAIRNYYGENGFMEMQILNKGEDLVGYNEENTRANLIFKIFEGPQVHVASIVLDGNTFTKDNVILNELEFQKGDLLTPAKIEESTARLQRTGYFGSVEIKTLEEKTGVEERTIVVRITERDPGVFTLGMGATNERNLTLRGYTSVAYRNILGTGRGASLRLEGNYNILGIRYPELKLTFGYLEPSLFSTRFKGRVNISRSKTVVDYDRSKVREVNQATWSIERAFTSHITGTWDLLSIATLKEFTIDPNIDFKDTLLDIASTGPSLDIDYRDNPFYPTRGHLTTFNLEYSSPSLGSSRTIEYWRASAGYNFYLPIPRTSVVWANSLRGGYLKNLSKEPDGAVPYDKKGFILGGRSTIRGYEAGTSEVFPNSKDLGSDEYALKTDAKMGLIKTELRFPIWKALEGALFYDGGTVQITGLRFADNYRDSAGFGFRYMVLMIPINIEFGWKLDRRKGEEPWRFHFSLGTF